jgi:succinoglycan biosynthesis transport protein ExoP
MNDYEPIPEKEIHLRDYLRVVRKRKTTLIVCFILTNLVVGLYTFMATPLYEASTKLVIKQNDPDPLSNASRTSYDPQFLETQSQIITNPSVIRNVVQLLELEKNYDVYFNSGEKEGSLLASMSSWVGGQLASLFNFKGEPVNADMIAADKEASSRAVDPPQSSGDASTAESDSATAALTDQVAAAKLREDEIVKVVGNNLAVRLVPDSRIVNVSYVSPNPVLAREIANAVSSAYFEKIMDMRVQSISYEVDWMSKKAEEERLKLDEAESELQRFRMENGIVTIGGRVGATPQELTELTSQYTRAETARKQVEAVYKKLRPFVKLPAGAVTVPVVASNPAIRAIRAQILQAEQSISDLSKKYGPKHPVMKRDLAELASLEAKLNQEISHVIETVKNEFELARDHEENIAQLLADVKNSTMTLNEKFIQYQNLERKVDTSRQLYDALIARIKRQQLTDRAQSIDVYMLEKASIPEDPVSPNKKRNIMFGLLLGVMGGIGLCFFVDYLDNTVKSSEDAQDRFHLPVIGTVPRLAPKEGTIEGILLSDDRSVIAESYKTLRTSLMLSSADAHLKGLLITSMLPGEGKTSSAVNLAITLGQTGKNVLLIDGDLRKPRVHKIFGMENTRGLSTYLAGASDESIFQKGPSPNLTIITAGPMPPNPSELLSSEKMKHLIQTTQKKFDFVLFDSPPVLTVTDALILSRMVESTLVVVRSAKTTYDIIEKGLNRLQAVKAPVAGLVINDIKMTPTNSYLYNYYSYQED